MTTRKIERRDADRRPQGRRARGDEGAALLEFALVSVLLFTLLLGIITFGWILSFKQDLTRSAAEGARAGAVASPGSGAQSAATTATNTAVTGFGKTCNAGGLTCTIPVTYDCDGIGAGTTKCVSVTLTYDYEHHPLIPSIPLISMLLPDTITAKSVAQVNP